MMPTHAARHIAPALLATALAAGLLSGCARRLNERHMLGANVNPLTSTPLAISDDPAPTLTGVDRSNWKARVVLVPVDGTVHGPVHHRSVRFAHETARQQGLYPTPSTALELGGGTGGAQAAEAALEPFSAFAQFLTMPLRLVVHPPAKATQSPRTLYKRDRDGGWSSGDTITDTIAPAPAH